jgi:cyanophycin synthetase
MELTMQVDFSQHEMFNSIRGWRSHEASSLLLSLAALSQGLDVKFFRSLKEAGFSHDCFLQVVGLPTFYRVSHGRRHRHFHGAMSEQVSRDASLQTKDKISAKAMLHRRNLATPVGGMVSQSRMQLLDALVAAGVQRFVLKPIAGSLGKNTFVNQSAAAVRDYLSNNAGDYLLEQYINGAEHRLFVVKGKVVAAYRFVPMHVVGNGKDTIRSLLETRLASREGNPFLIGRKPEAAEVELVLLMQKLKWDDVPAQDKTIWLTAKQIPDGNGDFIACLDVISDAMKQLAIDAAQTLGAHSCAIDMMVDSVGQPFVLELNLRPMIAAACFPTHGRHHNLDVPNAILASLFRLSETSKKQVVAYDFAALKAELFRDGRTTKGVNAADFATFS